jgi:hypothetical protein
MRIDEIEVVEFASGENVDSHFVSPCLDIHVFIKDYVASFDILIPNVI